MELSSGERSFFADANPLGFILFKRNCLSADQVRHLIDDLKTTVGREDVPILIDQEGGRVARLSPPSWGTFPPARLFGQIYAQDHELGLEAVRLNASLIANELTKLGVNVNCAPVLDLEFPVTHESIGDRSFGADPDAVAVLGRAFAETMLSFGILPVVKHMPGHGRATVDPHLQLPAVDAVLSDLDAQDFKPFAALRDMPLAMTSHILFRALDPMRPASLSPLVIQEIIRQKIGFDGLLISDDLDMKALEGRLEDLTRETLRAGTDIVLHCSGSMPAMVEVMRGIEPMKDVSWTRWQKAQAMMVRKSQFIDVAGITERLDMILAVTALHAQMT